MVNVGTGGTMSVVGGINGTHGCRVPSSPPPMDTTVVWCVSIEMLVVDSATESSKRCAALAATWPHATGVLDAQSASAAAATPHATRLFLRGFNAYLLVQWKWRLAPASPGANLPTSLRRADRRVVRLS